MADKNQSEAEVFAVTTTGRRGLDEAVEKMRPEIMAMAAPNVAKAGSSWMQRAVISVYQNDALTEVLKTRTGLFSVVKCFERAATMGLQIGGQFPHAHLVPFQGKAELIVSADGYKFAALHGPGAVLAGFEYHRVYEADKIRIDIGAAKVDHSIDPMTERGRLIGFYGIMTRSDGSRLIDYMSKADTLKVRDAHSGAYKAGRSTPWKTDEDAMAEKTAVKRFLRRFAAESEGLSMLYGQEDEGEYIPPPRDVSERMADRLEDRTEKIDAAPLATAAAEPSSAEEAEKPAEIKGGLF